MTYAELLKHLETYGQTHLLKHWDVLTADERSHLSGQIMSVDFAQLAKLRTGETKAVDWKVAAPKAKSPPAVRIGKPWPYDAAAAKAAGEKALRAGEVGAVLVAGGQGTRLGFDHPKGMYHIGPVSDATLFQILLEKIVAAGRRYGVRIPLFLMTSPATNDETIAFLERHNRFGLAENDLVVFCQGTMPAVDMATGKLLLASSSELALSPDGHGGLPAALSRSPAQAIIRDRRLKHLFYFQVDNPLVTMCDPTFLGYHILSQSEVSTQVVAKQDPAERVGVLAEIDGQALIIEYSDLPEADAARRTDDGALALWAGNTAVHVFDAAFLLSAAAGVGELPFHIARKKVPFVDESGNTVDPTEPNAFKFEKFIFDMMPVAKRTLVVEVTPADAFAPVKNAPGSKTDSPEHVKAAIGAQGRKWLRAAGAEVADGTIVEISPLFALDADQVREKIKPGTRYEKATYLRSDE